MEKTEKLCFLRKTIKMLKNKTNKKIKIKESKNKKKKRVDFLYSFLTHTQL